MATVLELHEKFIATLKTEINKGYGIIPLVGSGFSTDSGIPIGMKFINYMRYVMWLCCKNGWNLQKGGWPDFPKWEELAKALNWGENDLCNSANNIIKDQSTDELNVTLEVVGAWNDWRSALHLLSRFRQEKTTNKQGKPTPQIILRDPDDHIKELFVDHLTRDKKPNPYHWLLAQLARPLRIHTVLTTNFDTLLEKAFNDVGISLSTFDVHVTGSLPDVRLVKAQDSIIKLHGSNVATRADFSLDEVPPLSDKESFFQYHFGAPRLEGSKRDVYSVKNHLLVLGFSGSDHRIIELIKFCLEEAQFKVFWVCHTFNDYLKAKKLFPSKYFSNNVVFVISHADNLLLDIYQRMTRTLPSREVKYPFRTNTAPFPNIPENRKKKVIEERKHIYRKITADKNKENQKAKKKGVIVRTPASPYSASVADAFWVLSGFPSIIENIPRSNIHKKIYNCVWLELEDFVSEDQVVFTILKELSFRTGMLETEGISLEVLNESPSETEKLQEIINHFRINPNEWILFITCRGLKGVQAGLIENGKTWNNQTADRHLANLFAKCGFNVVHFPATKAVVNEIDVNKILEDDPTLNPFLHSLCLCRKSRSFSSFFTCAHSGEEQRYGTEGLDNDKHRLEETDFRNIKTLMNKHNLIHYKPGGFYWMNPTTKQNIISQRNTDYDQHLAINHFSIARSYDHAFRATDDYNVFIECLYHILQAAKYAEKAMLRYLIGEDESISKHIQWTLLRLAIFEAITLLKKAEWAIRRGVNSSAAYIIFCEAPILASVRKTISKCDGVTKFLLNNLVNTLNIRFLEVTSKASRVEGDYKTSQKSIKQINQLIKSEQNDTALPFSRFTNSLIFSMHLEEEKINNTTEINNFVDSYLANLKGKNPNVANISLAKLMASYSQAKLSTPINTNMLEKALQAIFNTIFFSNALNTKETLLRYRKIKDKMSLIENCRTDIKEVFKSLQKGIWEATDNKCKTSGRNIIDCLACNELARSQLPGETKELKRLCNDTGARGCYIELLKCAQILLQTGNDNEREQRVRLLLKGMRAYATYLEYQAGVHDLTCHPAQTSFMEIYSNKNNHRVQWLKPYIINEWIQYVGMLFGDCALETRTRESYLSQANSALCLAYLGRYSEAHRRINDGMGYLSRSKHSKRHQDWAILEIRRGEIYLQQAKELFLQTMSVKSQMSIEDFYFPKNDIASMDCIYFDEVDEVPVMKTIALLEDAWSAFTRGEKLLAGNSRSSWWWGVLYLLKLMVLSSLSEAELLLNYISGPKYHPYRIDSLCDRGPGGRIEVLTNLVEKSFLQGGLTEPRKLRIIHFAASTWHMVQLLDQLKDLKNSNYTSLLNTKEDSLKQKLKGKYKEWIETEGKTSKPQKEIDNEIKVKKFLVRKEVLGPLR
jgi:SIR2-like protein